MDLANIVDIAALLIVLISALSCMKKGFINCVFGLLTVVVSLGVAFLFVNVVVETTDGFFGLQESVTTAAIEALSESEIFNLTFSEEIVRQELGDKIPEFLIEIVIDNFKGQILPDGVTLAVAVGQTVGKLSATLAAWFALFLITKLLLRFLRKIINSIVEKISLIKAIDKLLGFAVGVVEGVVVLCALLAFLTMFPLGDITSVFAETELVYYLYNQNPLTTILGKII